MRRPAALLLLALAAPASAVTPDMYDDCMFGASTNGRAIAACSALLMWRETKQERMPELLVHRGEHYVDAGRYEDALRDFDSALAIRRADAGAYGGRCRARALWNRDLHTAPVDCDVALQLRPGDGTALEARGLVYYRRGEYRDALGDFDAAIGKSQRGAGSVYMRGLTKLKLGDATGDADIAGARTVDPGIADTYAHYGVTP